MNLYTAGQRAGDELGVMEGRGQGVPADALLMLLDGRRLSPAQRRIAQYLLDHMPDSAFLSSVVLARRAGVSQPSVTRFAAALGFSGYPAFRDALRIIALDSPAAAVPAVPGPATLDDAGNPMQAAVAAEIANLRALHQLLADPRVITELARELAASVPLAVLGLRISAPLAEYFAFAARRIHPDVRCLTYGGSVVFDALLHVSEAGGKWLVGFALPRYPAETVQALRFARQLGMRTAVISDARFVPFAAEADVLLPAGVGTRLLFSPQAAPAVLTAVIVQAMADADPVRSQDRLRQQEQLSTGQGVFMDR
jgi:DNA-binding MurR/RpiR family transcriptional regulator